MANIGLSDAELLKFAIESGMLNTALVHEKIEMQKKKEFLEKHPYKIYQGKDGKWYTYLPDEKKGRILKKRTTKEDIENVVIEYWRQEEENPTINDIFYEWLGAKVAREEIVNSTKDRYGRQYEQCFVEFGKKRIKSVCEYDIEQFLLDSIHEFKLTRKGFSNLRTLVFGIFKLAKKKKFVNFSITEVVNDIEISRKLFRKEVKSDEEQVFMIDELPKVTDYLESNQDIINLGILLLFKTGLRIGELVALKKCDVVGNIIHVCRTEIRYKSEDGSRVYEVRDFPKTEAGIRDVVLPDNSLWKPARRADIGASEKTTPAPDGTGGR